MQSSSTALGPSKSVQSMSLLMLKVSHRYICDFFFRGRGVKVHDCKYVVKDLHLVLIVTICREKYCHLKFMKKINCCCIC